MALTKVTGASFSTLRSDMPVSVLDYGAVGDGSTDDTAAIQAAIDAGETYLVFPNTGSDYMFTTLTINSATDNRAAIILQGHSHTESGSANSALQCTSTTATAIDIQDGNCVLKNLRIKASAARTASGTTADGIHIRGDLTTNTNVRVILEDVWVMSQPGYGFVIEGAEMCRMIQCQSTSNGARGFYVKSAGSGSAGISNTFDTCRAYNNDLGGWYIESRWNTFINCQSLVNNQSSTLYAGSSYEVELTSAAHNNIFINMDVECQSQHAGTAGVDRPTTMYGWNIAADDVQLIGGITAGFDTGVLVTGDFLNVKNMNFNNANSGGNMTYAIDNNAVSNAYLVVNSSGSAVTTLVRNKNFNGWVDGQFFTNKGPILCGDPDVLTGAGAVSTTSSITHVETTGTNALTLGSPSFDGHMKYIVMTSDGGTGTLTPTALANGTTITFDDVGDSAHLLFTDGKWHFMGGTATLA